MFAVYYDYWKKEHDWIDVKYAKGNKGVFNDEMKALEYCIKLDEEMMKK